MSEYIVQRETLTALADEIRELSGTTESLSIDAMTTNLGAANIEVGTQEAALIEITKQLENKMIGTIPALQSKTISPSASVQTITPDYGYDGLSEVVVNGINLQAAITVNPTDIDTVVTPIEGYYLDKVVVNGDSNLIPANIAAGVEIFGVEGTHSGTSIETCTVNISSSYNGYCGVVWSTIENDEIIMKHGYVYGTYISTYYSAGLQCLKNSYILFGIPTEYGKSFTATVAGGVEAPTGTSQAANTYGIPFYVTDDGSIDLSYS